MAGENDLGMKAGDVVNVGDMFGQAGKRMAGVAGTLHITTEADLASIPKAAWDLSVASKKPVVIVVKAV